MPRIKEIPKIDRPREKFFQKGPDALTTTELLAIFLGSGIKGKNVKRVAESLLKRFGSKLIDAKVDELKKIDGIGEVKAVQLVSAFTLAKRLTEKKDSPFVIKNALDVFHECKYLARKKQEHLVVLYLDSRNILIESRNISIGLIDKNLVHPREIFKPAIELLASRIIMVHNHPSGNHLPSAADEEVTLKIIESGKILDIPVIDHVIISNKGFFSFADNFSAKENTPYLREGVFSIDLLKLWPKDKR